MKDESHYLPARFELSDIAAAYINIVQFDVARYFIWAGAIFLLINVMLARQLTGRKIRSSSPSAQQMVREILTSLRTAAIFAAVGTSIFILRKLGWIDVYLDPSARGWAYFAFSVAALIVLHDAWFYWTHRLIHHPRLFRRAHRTHHKSFNPSPWTAYSFDISEAIINAVFLPIALLLIPASPLAIFIFLSHMMFRNALGHCGYEIFPSWSNGRPVLGWLTTVTHHDLHHEKAGYNFGLYFSWWDRWMKTEHPHYGEKFAQAIRKPLRDPATGKRNPARALAIAVVFAVCTLAYAPVGEANTDDNAGVLPDGIYASEGHGVHVRFKYCDQDPMALCADIVWAWDPETLSAGDSQTFLGGFQWREGRWRDGWLVHPTDGKTYRGKISPMPDGTLKLKGCALVFCKTQTWRRVDEIPGCVAARRRTL